MQSTPVADEPVASSLRILNRLVLLNHPQASRLGYGDRGSSPFDETTKLAFGAWSVSDLLAFEDELCKRWIQEIESFGPGDALLLNALSFPEMTTRDGLLAPIWNAAERCLGDRLVVTFSVPGPEAALGLKMKRELHARGYTFDPQTVAAEAWGESFEGCVPNYAAHIAAGLQLPLGFPMRYDMTLADAPFTRDAEFIERVWVGETDVSLYFFQTPKGRPFAIFFPGVLKTTAPLRHANIASGARRLEFTNKLGQGREIEARNGVLPVPLYVDGYGEPIYIWAADDGAAEFNSILSAATISRV